MTDEFRAAHARMARPTGALPPKIRDLIGIAVNSAVTHLNSAALRGCVRSALNNGATRAEIMETFQLVAVLGIHAMSIGAPLLDRPSTADDQVSALREQFIRRRGYWDEGWEHVLRLDPDFFAAYLDFSAVPWERGVLEPKVKELIYVAIDASATHMFAAGLSVHIDNARRHGATTAELMEVLRIASTIGIQTLEVGVPILLDELQRRRTGHAR